MSDKCKDIVIKGYSGSRGAAFLASENMNILQERFRPDYLERELETLKSDCISETNGAEPGCENMKDEIRNPAYPYGILRGLYDLAVGRKCGMRIELKKIPIRQFVIEICEICGENPYRIASDSEIELCGNGDSSQGEKRAKELWEQGIAAACIGCTTDGLDKVITDKTNIEYINKE